MAEGTRGANMLSGVDRIKVHGDYIPVRAKMVTIDCLSAHADYIEMTEWLSRLESAPRKTFMVHGEPQSLDAFRSYLEDELSWDVDIPVYGQAELINPYKQNNSG